MKVQVINKSNNKLPEYATSGSAGLDLRAFLEAPIHIYPGDIKLIHTGIHMQLPLGYEARIQPRSGLALKHGITVLNAPGCIDCDYTGEVGVILINHSQKTFTIEPGDRIAQMIVSKYEQVEWDETDALNKTERGEGGFSHTGVK